VNLKYLDALQARVLQTKTRKRITSIHACEHLVFEATARKKILWQ